MSTVAVPIDVLAGRPDTTNTPETVYITGTNFPADGIAFTSGGSKALYLKIGAELYGNSGNWTLDLHWYSRSGSTSGNVNWVAAMAAITPGDAISVEAKAFATSQNVTTTVNATAKGETLTSITITNLDGVNAGDTVWIKITRGADSMTGDAILIRGSASYQDGSTGTAGSGDFVGPASATTTAVVLFNGTTGKLGMNSVVTVDGSGNMAGVTSINNMCPMMGAALSADSSGITTTSTVVITVSIPVAGTWVYAFETSLICSTVTGNVTNHTVNFTGTQSVFLASLDGYVTASTSGTITTNTNNTALALTPTVTTSRAVRITGTVVCSTSGNLTFAIQRLTSGTIIAQKGSYGVATKVA